jgi:acyl-CoA thioesterase FadM
MDLWVRDRLGIQWQRKEGAEFSMVRSSQFEYLAPCGFLDDLTICGRITKWGRTSFEIGWEGSVCGENGEGKTNVFRGWMTHVCVEKLENGKRKPKEIDETFREKIVTPRARL